MDSFRNGGTVAFGSGPVAAQTNPNATRSLSTASVAPGGEDAFLHAADRVRRAPFLTSNIATLAERGILGSSWRESPPASSSDGLNLTLHLQLRSLYPVA